MVPSKGLFDLRTNRSKESEQEKIVYLASTNLLNRKKMFWRMHFLSGHGMHFCVNDIKEGTQAKQYQDK
jgi:hypothetical protein